MQTFTSVIKMQEWCKEQKREGKTIGLVPTMGYLHQGHLALVREARRACDIVVVSIFVNPIQFGVGEDFEDYPRDLDKDSLLLEQGQVDAVFAPSIKEMYPLGYNSFVEVLGEISQKLCAQSRPIHFRGVTTVVSKLFHICLPDQAFFGQKDAQQVMIIEKMVRELNFPLSIVRVPIVREEDGLALSSRNVYLDAEQRKQALVLNRSLQAARELIQSGERNVAKVKSLLEQTIKTSPGAIIGYAEIYDASDLTEVEEIKGQVLIALAVKFGTTRLIDNLLVEV
ncbi:MAG: pantoate--beta-alanine ligase [Firmicutes bacterium HGW-Firmicutes-15]|nr:MAG: pantoate--beta-alanine ligase [Firmicutes bacterium HGW-Firmicutes-15]